MPIIIVEGADGAGKTTLCKKYLDGIHNSIYVHFPIRDIEKDIISKCEINSSFMLCGSFKGFSMEQIQDVILENIEINSHEILRLHKLDVTVILDRYVLSNIVYRQLHLGQEISIKDLKKLAINEVMSIAQLIVLTESPDVLFARTSSRNESIDELDKLNEEKRNIEIANNLFNKLALVK